MTSQHLQTTLNVNQKTIGRDFRGQSAKTADWLVDNDVIRPVLRNCACANRGKLKIDRSMAAERERAMLNYKDLQDCCS